MDRQKTDIQVWFKSGIYTIVIRDLSFFLSLPSLKNQFMEITTISINSSVFHMQLFKALGYGYGLVVKAPAVQA